MAEFLQGKKTYIGIIIALAGAFGVFSYISESDFATTLNTLFEFVGLIFAIYGRYKVKPN